MKAVNLIAAIVIAVSCMFSVNAFAKDNVVTWSNPVTSDPRAQFTEIGHCEGTALQCAVTNANLWTVLGTVDLPGTTYTHAAVREGVNHSYRAGYGNIDFPPTNYAGPVDVYVPFGGAASSVPGALGVSSQ